MTSIVDFLSQLADLNIVLWVENDRLRFRGAAGAMTPDLRAELTARKAELLTFLQHRQPAPVSSALPVTPMPRPPLVPLAFAQERIWFLAQWRPDSLAYSIPEVVHLSGPLDPDHLARSFALIVQRHEVLRTTFATVNDQPVQQITPTRACSLPLIDLSDVPPQDRQSQAYQLAQHAARQPFDLAQGPLLRTTLVRLAPDDHLLLLNLHHIIADGWSMGVLVRELATLYAASPETQAQALPPLAVQYADFALWQRRWLDGAVLDRERAYWQQQLAAAPKLLDLPTDRPRPSVQTFDGQTFSLTVDADLTKALRVLSQREGVTLFMTLLAAFKTLLYRLSGQDDIIIGAPIAGRTQVELEGLIGCFVNTLALRTDLSDQPSFCALLQRVQKTTLDAYAHQNLPFAQVVEAVHPDRSSSHAPLFQVLCTLQNAPQPDMALADVQLNLVSVESGTAKYDLSLFAVEQGPTLALALEYNTDLFDATTIARWANHFQTLLAAIVADPTMVISRLPLLSLAERQLLLTDWNGQAGQYPQAQRSSLHALFEQQVLRTPDAVALSFEGRQLTYRELNERANQLAHYLRARGVGPEVVVGLALERSLELVIGILGILKAGGAYLPLDPSYPAERLQFMLKDARAPVLLTQQQHLAVLYPEQTEVSAQVVCLNTDWPAIATQPQHNPIDCTAPNYLAYIIYTSGSTGKPKGTLICHRNVVRLFEATQDWFHFTPEDVWTLFHSYAFDFSVWELWGALLYGGRLVVVPFGVTRSPESFYELLDRERVTVLSQTPSAFRQVIQIEETSVSARDLALRLVIFGGEALDVPSLRPWFDRHGDQQPQLVNMYGITETTVHVTYQPLTSVDADAGQCSIIGRPIPDLRVYVLDAQMQPAPIGVPGELYVGGAGLARGYLRRPDLTAQRFVPNPFNGANDADAESSRLYRSGDLASWQPDGNLEYLGRLDDQVKIRGFRIELGEIETAINQHPEVRESVVVVREDAAQAGGDLDKRLVAYVVLHASDREATPPTVGDLRRFLQKTLPDYMIPSAFMLMEAVPLTPSGKLDRRALPAVEATRPDLDTTYVASRTPNEQVLTEIWANVLGLEQVGIHDNFFALGGHSLLTMRLVTQIHQTLNIRLPLSIVLDRATVADLASYITNIQWAANSMSAPPSQSSEDRDEGEL